MIPFSIVYKLNAKCVLAGVTLWQQKYGILSKRFLVGICVAVNIFVSVLTFFSMFFEVDYDPIGTLLFVILEIILFSFIIIKSIKGKIIPLLARTLLSKIGNDSEKIKFTLREEDFEILTDYRKSNYYYDEIEACFDMGTYVSIFVDKKSCPVIIPLITLNDGAKKEFRTLLKEKAGQKYESEVQGQK